MIFLEQTVNQILQEEGQVIISLSNINMSKLSRDYISYPLQKSELLNIDDFRYLYIELNLSLSMIANIFNKNEDWAYRMSRKYRVKKSEEQIKLCREKTNLIRFGTNCPTKNADIKNKIRNTFNSKPKEEIERINKLNSERLKETWAKRSEEQKKAISKKISDTWYSSADDVKNQKRNKLKNAWKNKTEKELQEYSSKIKHIKASRTPRQIAETNSKIQKIWDSRSTQERNEIATKISNTWNLKTAEEKQSIVNKYNLQIREILEKTYQTKKTRGTFNISKQQDKIFQELSKHFYVETEYKSELYPYKCDFYIPKLDLYIEYQGSWTHGCMPFEDNEICKIKLAQWESKAATSKFYKNAIYTWTDLDVRKRMCAKEHNLNWIEFFKYKDILNWIDTYLGEL